MCNRLFHGVRSGCVDLYDERFLDGRLHSCVRAAGVRRLEPWRLSCVGLPWDFVQPHGHSVLPFGLRCQAFHFSPNQSKKTKDQAQRNPLRDTTSNKHTENQTKIPTQHDNFDLSNVGYVSSSAKFSYRELFELKNYQVGKHFTSRGLKWSYDMEGHTTK